jgi:uncharacterized protein YdiU (UPF0061 family)
MKLENLTLTTPYLTLDDEFYDVVKPIPLEQPYLISYSPEVAKLIDLDPNTQHDPHFLDLLNGAYFPKGSKPFAMCYAGHQFGHYVPRLGDGRSHNLGKVNGWNLQLKGSGETIYARMADGRAAIRSSIREFLMSEAMHHLGIPTTRALGVIGSKTEILRDWIEYGAMTMRLSPSWVRFGTFEYFYYVKEYTKLEQLAEYVIAESYPHLTDNEDRFFKMFSEVVDRTAHLIAKWQGVGFTHGVMNTDNMSIAGLTIDYGPYAMLDDYDFNFVGNTTDRLGRYAYGQQPNIAYWNLTMLAKALSPIISHDRMQKKLDDYGAFIYPNAFVDEMRKKLGLEEKLDEDVELIKELVGTLQDALVDHTLFFRTLSHYSGDREPLFDIVMEPVVLDQWLNLYDARLEKEKHLQPDRQKAMLKTNPKYVLKNYMLQNAIALAENGNFSMVEKLFYIAQHPYDELPEYEEFSEETPEFNKNFSLSCSS